MKGDMSPSEATASLVPANSEDFIATVSLEVRQPLADILENACTHGSPGGVRVAAALEPAKTGDVVEISVSDKGKGIAPADLSGVTQRYYRGANASQDGLGLGLWISKATVEAHGGELTVSSEPGAGTTVGFTIPLRDGTPAGKLAGT
jgi:signal transduction histidine kinase